MLFVVILHIINIHYHEEQFGNQTYFISRLLKSFSISAVTTFVLISGYFGIRFNVRKCVKYLGMVFFYSVMPLFFLGGVMGETFSFRQDILYFFPVLTKRYWFATAYFALYLLAPYYNCVFENRSFKDSLRLMVLILGLFVVWPTICYTINGGQLVSDGGLGIVHLSVVYLWGRFLSLHQCFLDKYTGKVWLFLYCICSLVLFVTHLIMTKILGFEFESFFSYHTVFVLVNATCLFAAFRKFEIKSRLINYIAGISFCVYLFHCQPWIWNFVIIDILAFSHESRPSYYYIVLLVLPLLFYLSSIIIEVVRRFVFGRYEEWLAKKVEELFRNPEGYQY